MVMRAMIGTVEMTASIRLLAFFAALAVSGISHAAAATYPASYRSIVDGSKREQGLLIYSNMAKYNWAPALAGFKRRYPWVKVTTLDLGPNEVAERYKAEAAAKRKTADLMVFAAPDVWQQLATRRVLHPYVSPESPDLPEWSKPMPGLYTFATAPMLIVYNKALLKPNQYPRSAAQLAAIAEANPARFRRRLTTYDASSHSFGYAVHWRVAQQGRNGWNLLARLGPLTRAEPSGAMMLDKVTTGEYLVAYYNSAVTVLPHMKDAGREKLVGWSLPTDGTPVMIYGMAITQAGASKNSSKLLLDYLLSREGQILTARGGLTPYRRDVRMKDVPFLTLDEVYRRTGGHVLQIGYDPKMLTDRESFVRRWNALFKKR